MKERRNSENKILSEQKIMSGIVILLLVVAVLISYNDSLILNGCKHNYKPKEIATSCTKDGQILQSCEKCGYECIVKKVPAVGHSYKEIFRNTGCLEGGIIIKTCLLCEDVIIETIPASGHSFEENIIAPTCIQSGRIDYECECGERLESKILLKKEHEYVEGFCSICGEEERPKELLGIFRITAYCPCEYCSKGWGTQTSSGRTAQPNHTIAVDKSIIPYFTEISINGHIYVAEDTGGAIKGKRIDIFFSTHEEVAAFGVQYIEVYKITHPQNQKGD